jgi:hypothetical protein
VYGRTEGHRQSTKYQKKVRKEEKEEEKKRLFFFAGDPRTPDEFVV